MIEKRNVEAFLRINGIPPTAPDEEIRSVLISARWNKNEVDTALMVLKENTKNSSTHVDTLHKVFNTDDKLNAAEISALLGIDVVLSSRDVGDIAKRRKRAQTLQNVLIFIFSILTAVGSISYFMYQEQVGFFKETSAPTTVLK